jgi:hypothetical protein
MATVDISNLAKSDQEALRKAVKTGDYSSVSEAALRVITDTPYDTGAVISRQVERSVTSSIRGIAHLFGLQPETDRQAEIESRAMFETNPTASWSSYIGGSIFDPINAIGVGRVKTAVSAGARYAALGGALGLLEPTYDEYEDSRVRNAALGAGTLGLFGAGVTGLVNKIAGKSASEVEEALTNQAADSLNSATTTPSLGGSKPRLRSGPATVRDPLTPEAMFEKEGTTGIPIDVNAYRPDEPINLTLPDGSLYKGTQEQAWKNGYLNITGWEGSSPFVPPKFQRTHGSPTPHFSGKGPVNFESDLDKAFYIIAKEEGKRSPADAKFLDFVIKNTGLSEAAARAEGKKIVNVVAQELKDVTSASEKLIPITWKPAPTKAPQPTRPSIEQTAQNAQEFNDSPKLSVQLFNEPVIHNGSPLVFNSDIDKAAVAVNKNSPNKKEYFDFIKNTFGINEQQTQKIIDDISLEVLQKINKTKTVEGKTLGEIPVKLSDTLDNIVNPVFKHMDDESKYIYNYSNFITTPDGKASFKLDRGFKQFMNQMRQIFPDIKVNEAVATAQGYQRLMDNLKLDKGAKFTSTNIRDFAKNRNGNLDAYIASVKRGDVDGCWS